MQNTALNPPSTSSSSSSSSSSSASSSVTGATATAATTTSVATASTITDINPSNLSSGAIATATVAVNTISSGSSSSNINEVIGEIQSSNIDVTNTASTTSTTTATTGVQATACNIVSVTPSSSSSTSSTTNGHETKHNGFVATNITSNNGEITATGNGQNETDMRGIDGQNNHADGIDGGGGGDGVCVAKNNMRLDTSNQEIIRLIGQYLHDIGLDQSVDTLMAESGCYLDKPAAMKFRDHVMNGEWNKADADIKDLEPLIEKGKPACLTEMKFILLEQKYLEHLDDGCPLDALHVLRNELTPLQHNISRVHQLSSYMMCSNNSDLHERAKWDGKGKISRNLVMERLQTFLPPAVMIQPRRLRGLLQQAVELQTQHCPCHNIGWETNLQNVSLLTDHCCTSEGFPMQTIQILSHHCDEVWFCKFSPDGLKLATGSKDATVIIWDVDPFKLTLKQRRTLDNQSQTVVAFVNWSPDSKLLLVGGPEDTPEICIWNVEDGKLVVKMQNNMEDSLTCGAFNRDGTKFVCGGQKGQFYLCDLSGQILEQWEGIRINSVAFRKDNKTILAADNHYRIRGYGYENGKTEFDILKEPRPIMTFSVNSADRLALLNISNQGLHLWDLEDRCLVRRFQGIRQSNFAIYSCFGGINESFVASGSEDKYVVIWHIKREEPIAKLVGHTKPVTCVSWNPVYTTILASASDDGTVRIWGPKTTKTNNANATTESDECSSSCSSSSSWNMTS